MKTIIIAEAGVNHNGKLHIAKKMVDHAKRAGADYIKFQSFDSNEIVTESAKKAEYQLEKNDKETQYQMLKKLEINKQFLNQIVKYSKKKKIKFLSTAFDKNNLEYLIRFKIDFIKVPSGEITNKPFLKEIKKYKKKILLSTGASTINEIKRAIKILGKKNLIVLHCNSAYPTPLKDINLNVLNTFKSLNFKYGLSDHSLDKFIPAVAVAMGASIIEKHFTLSRKMKGPDHKSSLLPSELKIMIDEIRKVEKALGKKEKEVSPSEKKNRRIIRRSIVAKKTINKGDIFSKNNLTSKRPFDGISPMNIDKIIGKKAKKKFLKDEKISI